MGTSEIVVATRDESGVEIISTKETTMTLRNLDSSRDSKRNSSRIKTIIFSAKSESKRHKTEKARTEDILLVKR